MSFNEHVKIREENFGSVIFETLKEKVFVTNESGKDILILLRKGYSADKISDILKDTYSNNPAQIKSDVGDFIGQLQDKGLLRLGFAD